MQGSAFRISSVGFEKLSTVQSPNGMHHDSRGFRHDAEKRESVDALGQFDSETRTA
jgi:hypothetical protein